MEICGNKIPKISKLVKVRDEDFGLLLVSKKTPILALNNDSKIIWNLIDGKKTILQIANYINENYSIDNSYKVVEEFVESCYKLRLLEFV